MVSVLKGRNDFIEVKKILEGDYKKNTEIVTRYSDIGKLLDNSYKAIKIAESIKDTVKMVNDPSNENIIKAGIGYGYILENVMGYGIGMKYIGIINIYVTKYIKKIMLLV